MKKSGLLLAAAAVAGMLLTGCGASQKSTFSPSVSCVYVAQDGSVSSALVKEYEGDTVNSKDLQQYLEAAVIRFNQENGAQGLAENKMGADKLPASLQSVTADKGVMKAVFDYASLEDLIKFRQTEDNEDTSNTVTELEVSKVADADAAGWLAEGQIVKADGSPASAEEIKSDAAASAARISGGGNIMFSGKVLYMTEGIEKKDEYTVTVPEGENALVVFK